MYRRALFLLLAAQIVLLTNTTAQPADRHAHPVRIERERMVDILHYRIELGLDHANNAFAGRTAVTFNPFHEITSLDLDAESFTVTNVTSADGAFLPFTHQNGVLSIELVRSIDFGDTTTVTVVYHASNYDVDGAKYGMYSRPDLGLDFRDETDSNPAMVNSLSFPDGARHWYPSHDHPAERATQEVIATVPADWKVLSNGLLMDVIMSDSSATYYWKQSLTHPTYLSAIVAGPFEILEDSLDGLSVDYWVYPKDVADARRSFGRTPEILRFFENTYGVPFPWEKYDQVTVPGIGGGAEATSSTLIGQATIHDARADIDYSSHWLVAHEGAHQWWGNLVTYRDWSHTWIAESFGSYSEVLWAEHDLGDEDGIVNLLDKRAQYLGQAKNEFIRPIVYDRWQFPNNNFDRHTYQKGANVLHMLRGILGDESFFRTHKYFLTRHAYEAVGTEDFVSAVKNATGSNLDWFFEQWLYKPGHPVIDAKHVVSADGSMLSLTLKQMQNFDEGVPVYRMPVTIEITDRDGRRREEVRLDDIEQTFDFLVRGSTPTIVVDPDRELLMELAHTKTQAELRAQMTSPSLGSRLEAASNLAADDPASRAALAAAMNGDSFWKIRETATTRLAADGDKEAAEWFVRVLGKDADSRVRAAAARSLGVSGTNRDADALRVHWSTDPSYRVQAAILDALGQIGRKSDESFIRSALDMKSPRDVLTNAAKRALDALGQE